ncbi:band 7 protein [Gloeothece citriformis PCC 7424]|uniref:Band 7 protein n=1 Tax=Gloeothece citriformis (strain PCC 7424) TaxID=65393 RepID=B7KIJ6_GLOC7|nr:SPFH domain-containing protein [Gloeothece citriformis]ACK69402.1 band 7 protein [Gloeothece citriformis PCC 7424]
MELIVMLLGMLGLGACASGVVIRNYYYICQPSEVLIFAGSRQKTATDQTIGYRLVKGGSSIKVPLIEEVFRMDLTNMIIDLKVVNAYSKGGVPLIVEGVANIKIAGEEPLIYNAIERLLGKKRKEIEQLAKETLEGNLRGVLANLTPEQANADQIAFAKNLLEEAEDDLHQLGLVLDSLQIQKISDEVSYLDSIGRKQRAELFRDARMGEAKAKAESMIKDSANQRITSLRRIQRDLEIAKADAEKRVRDAQTKRVAMIAEVESVVMTQLAKVQAEVKVQTERIKQVEQQLQADVIAPAEANCQQMIAKAQAQAAKIVEDGKAQAEGTKKLAHSWTVAGTNAKEIFLFQKLELLLKLMAASVPEVAIDKVTIIDGNNGTSVPKIASFMEQLRQATGVDVAQIAEQLSSQKLPSNGTVYPEKPLLTEFKKL